MPAGGLVTAGLGLSLVSAIYGGVKANQANKLAQSNLANRPKYNPLPEDNSAINLAESQANQGLGAGASQALLNNSQASTASLANASLMGGGDGNTLAGIEDRSGQQLNNIALYNDQARQSHLSSLLGEYRQRANMRQANADKQFQINQYAPWADKQQLYTQQQQAGQNMMMQGLSSAGKGLMSYGGADQSGADITMGASKPGNYSDYGYSGFGDFGGGRSTSQMEELPITGTGENPAPSYGFAPYH